MTIFSFLLMPRSDPLQKAVQEKFRQAGENLDDLNGWLDKVEREIASQEILSEDVNNLKSQIHSMKVKRKKQTRKLLKRKALKKSEYLYKVNWRHILHVSDEKVHRCTC